MANNGVMLKVYYMDYSPVDAEDGPYEVSLRIFTRGPFSALAHGGLLRDYVKSIKEIGGAIIIEDDVTAYIPLDQIVKIEVGGK